MADSYKPPTRTEIAMSAIRSRIQKSPGAKLPSIRRLAEQQGFSKSTIVEAYDRLVAEGEVAVKPGSGFYAAARARPLKLAEPAVQFDRAIDPLWIMRHSLVVGDPSLRPGCGWLPDEWLPGDVMRRVLRTIARGEDANVTAYGTPRGFYPLRDQLARRLGERDITASPDSILLTESATRAIDLISRFFLQPGDTVLVDDPCYFNFPSMMQALRVDVVGIPYTLHGPDLDAFAAACIKHRPKLYVTTAVLHNPTSVNISAATSHRLLRLAEVHDLILVEDTVYADLDGSAPPGLAALDGLDRVVLLGSFSKTLSGALRSGFIAARGDLIEGLTDLALATSFGVSDLPAQITHRLLVDGSYRHHLEGLRPRLARNMSMTIDRLQALGCTPWVRPDAGMFVWVQLPAGVDSSDIARRALEHELVLAPGNIFSVSQSAGRYMRFNVSQCNDKRVFDVLENLLS
ncbi:MAG TPA: PLP-dependent aminotransferase family protein [Paraburkholderia sp.]|jgi:DNA-binding transcriptional MocR family regulator